MRKGNKVKKQVQVPRGFQKKDVYKEMHQRLIDTDGCLYVDVPSTRTRFIKHRFEFYQQKFADLNFVKDNLLKMGYHPTHNTRFSISLEGNEK